MADDAVMNRRELLRLLGTAMAAGLAPGALPVESRAQAPSPTPGAAADATRPNFVFLLTDDHRADYMGCAGHRFIRTPHMDRLAREGVFFNNAFITTSLCSPSRGSFHTGMYASRHGCRNNLMTMDRSRTTFLEYLAAAGWESAFIGKWHMPGALPTLRGVDPFITFTMNTGQGRYYDCPLVVGTREVAARKHYVDEDLSDYALEFLRRKRSAPFCLMLAFKAPHHDWRALPEFATLYDDVDVDLPDEADPWLGFTGGNMFLGTGRPLPALVRDYCRAITSADALIGRVLAELDRLGVAESTVVVYASDNGYLWGEHRKVDKRWAYEPSIRVPFIVRYPRLVPDPGRRAQQMVLNVDLAPSLLDLAALPVPPDMQGRSWAPILQSAGAQGRSVWLYEHYPDYPYPVPRILAVRTDKHKYIEYEGLPPELFDLITDPGEQRNLIGQRESEELVPRMKRLLAGLQVELQIPT